MTEGLVDPRIQKLPRILTRNLRDLLELSTF